jgi:hypothetical protein
MLFLVVVCNCKYKDMRTLRIATTPLFYNMLVMALLFSASVKIGFSDPDPLDEFLQSEIDRLEEMKEDANLTAEIERTLYYLNAVSKNRSYLESEVSNEIIHSDVSELGEADKFDYLKRINRRHNTLRLFSGVGLELLEKQELSYPWAGIWGQPHPFQHIELEMRIDWLGKLLKSDMRKVLVSDLRMTGHLLQNMQSVARSGDSRLFEIACQLYHAPLNDPAFRMEYERLIREKVGERFVNDVVGQFESVSTGMLLLVARTENECPFVAEFEKLLFQIRDGGLEAYIRDERDVIDLGGELAEMICFLTDGEVHAETLVADDGLEYVLRKLSELPLYPLRDTTGQRRSCFSEDAEWIIRVIREFFDEKNDFDMEL